MTSRLFPGPASSSAPIIPRSFATYAPAGERPVVRHLAGYDDFASWCPRVGADPASLASDLDALIAFVRDRKNDIKAEELEDQASIFFGNVLVQQRNDADWMQCGDHFSSAGNERQRFDAKAAIWHLADSDAEMLRTSLDMLHCWISDETTSWPKPQ
ncbi:MAG: hypothetical protein ABW091_02765 [Microbacterium sp.]